ncbi:ABC transporter permease [Acidobacteriota bacterium]
MSIKEKGYTHWDGELKPGRFPWKPITRYGIKLTFQKKFFKLFYFITLIPAVVYLAGVYVSERLEDFQFMFEGDNLPLNVNPAYFKSYLTGDFILFMIVMILVFAGAGLISDDLKHNSLQLYFSRPIKKRDFFIGKSAVLIFYLLLVTLIPGLIIFIFKLIFAGSFKFFLQYPWLLLSIVGYSILITGFFSCYALFLSAMSKNRRYVAIMIFGVYIFSDILYEIFNGIFHRPEFSLLSVKANLQQVGAAMFKQPLPHNVSWILSLFVLSGFCLLAIFILSRKVRGVEVVK